MKKKYSARLKVSKSRKSKLGKTKPNFNKMVKEQCKRYEQLGEKKIGETKPNLVLPSFNIKLNISEFFFGNKTFGYYLKCNLCCWSSVIKFFNYWQKVS